MKHYATKRESVLEAIERAFDNGHTLVAHCREGASAPTVTIRSVPTYDEALRVTRIGYGHLSWFVRFPDGAEMPL